MPHELPDLPYGYDELEPSIDKETMQLHHDIHHKGYVGGLNKAEEALEQARKDNNFALIKHFSREVAFHGSGHIFHNLFWKNMAPDGGTPEGAITEQINKDFGSFDAFQNQFSAATNAVEGSGWGVLGWRPLDNKLVVLQSEKHQNLTNWGVQPLLVCDVWEHAYYLKYQNKRAEYVKNWWNVVNWKNVNENFENAK